MSRSEDRSEAGRWLDTAAEDLAAARALATTGYHAHACFSAQQCAEKAVKDKNGKAVDLAEKDYQVQLKEYRLGVITSLDLLRLLTDMQNVRRQWLVSRSTARLNDTQLRITMGEGL